MNFFKKALPFFFLLGIVIVFFIIHKIIFYSMGINEANFHYTLGQLYPIFLFFSLVIFSILLVVKKRSFDNVGMVFMILTCVKMIFCYLILRPLLQIPKFINSDERINFFILFMLFLFIETGFTIRLVNEKK